MGPKGKKKKGEMMTRPNWKEPFHNTKCQSANRNRRKEQYNLPFERERRERESIKGKEGSEEITDFQGEEEEMGTLQTWRKAYGALKDHTTVGLAHVNSDFKVTPFPLNFLFQLFGYWVFFYYLSGFFSALYLAQN